MGNCSPKPKRLSWRSSKTLADPSPETVQFHGSESSAIAWRIRVALMYKRVQVEFVESSAARDPFLRCGSETIAGSEESLHRFIDNRFGGPPAAMAESAKRTAVADVVVIQHRSIMSNVEGMSRWVAKMISEEGGDGRNGRAAEGRRMGKLYSDLVEIMLEHAQMEERFLFPVLERTAGYDACRRANEEHGRDFPLINGIKEDMKSLLAMNVGGTLYKEALLNLSRRLNTLQEHCKQHFEEEERELLPLVEAAERMRREEGEEQRWVDQMVGVMGHTHSPLFPLFTAVLPPRDALRYVSLVAGAEGEQAIAMLRSIASTIQDDTAFFSSPRKQ